MRLVAFDLETTGLKIEEGHKIIEFCFIELSEELDEMGRLEALVDPGRPLSGEIQKITGITPEMVEGRPPFAHHAPRIQRLVQDATLVAHNHRFDIGFLHHELVAAGQPGLRPDHPAIDTLAIERAVNSHSLGACYERYFGKPMDDAHRSAADTWATVEVLRKQREVHAARLPETLHGLRVSDLRKHFDPEFEPRVWMDHGHRFYQDGDEIVRFGFGKFVGQPVQDHPSYLLWMRDRDFPPDTLAVVNRFLEA